MKEELIRVENGHFTNENRDYQFNIFIARGECVGVYVDDHLTSGTAYLDIFKGCSHMTRGTAFCAGTRVGPIELRRWILQNTIIMDKNRFASRELTARDFILALGRPIGQRQRRQVVQRLHAPESERMAAQLGLSFPLERKLTSLSVLDYFRLAVFRAWFWSCRLLVLDRLTEILRQHDMDELMRCVQLLQGQGAAVFLFDMDEEFLYRYVNRLDVVKNHKTYYRLYPDEFGTQLYDILGWRRRNGGDRTETPLEGDQTVLIVSDLVFPATPPLRFQIRGGEIALLQDENYNTVSRIRDCFLGEQSWLSGTFCLDGKAYAHAELSRLIGSKIGVQIERPDRPGGVLFDNMTALDNLSTCLLAKAGRHLIRHAVMDNILTEASQWFRREDLLRPLSEWPLPERLRFSYFKWYFLNPRLLICFFPFAGQESAHHEMIIHMLVACARRGMAIWVISSGLDAICEKTENSEFLQRLRYING
nr:hypothetical protein [uncultured Agathobaculum sp.]